MARHWDGTEYKETEMPGPENVRQWTVCWRVFCTIMRSLQLAVHAALTAYEQNIHRLCDRYPDCWGLIYQADDDLRAEIWEEFRRELLTRAQATPLAPPRLWDAAVPWSAVILESAGGPGHDLGKEFTRDQLIEPPNLWISRSSPGAPPELPPELLESSARRAARDHHMSSGSAARPRVRLRLRFNYYTSDFKN